MAALGSVAYRRIYTGGHWPWMAKTPVTGAEEDFPLTTLYAGSCVCCGCRKAAGRYSTIRGKSVNNPYDLEADMGKAMQSLEHVMNISRAREIAFWLLIIGPPSLWLVGAWSLEKWGGTICINGSKTEYISRRDVILVGVDDYLRRTRAFSDHSGSYPHELK